MTDVISPKPASVTQRTLSPKLRDAEAQTSRNQLDKTKFTTWRQLRNFVFSSWLNLALVPLVISGFVVRYTRQAAPIVFVINFLAILLLGSWLSYATKELALRAGGLAMALVVVLGNAIQLIVTIITLVQGQIVLVQTSLIGSVFSNMVLLTGLALITGGYNRQGQYFDRITVNMQLNYLFLVIGVAGISTLWNSAGHLVPDIEATGPFPSEGDSSGEIDAIVLVAGANEISRAASILLIFVHILFLCWAFSEPVKLYAVRSQTSSKLPGRSIRAIAKTIFRHRPWPLGSRRDAAVNGGSHPEGVEEEEHGEPQTSTQLAIFILVFFTVLIGFCATFATDSVDSLTSGSMTKSFVGFVLFPIFSYNLDAIFLAREDRLDYAFVITIGGSMQILALILPLAVLIGWMINKPEMVIVFDGFQIVLLELSCVVMKYVCSYGSTDWFHGVILVVFYLIVAISTWFYPH